VTEHERIVIVGASAAGVRAGQTLRREGFSGRLTIVGEERHLPYRRPPLSKQLLLGEITQAEAFLPVEEEIRADWKLGCPTVGLDITRREVTLVDGEQIPFDGLVIATGAVPKRPPSLPELDGIHTLRTLDDCLALRQALMHGRPRVGVIGAGFIGCEIASSCRALGLEVVLVDRLPQPLSAIGVTVGHTCAVMQRDHGVDLRLSSGVQSFEGSRRIERVNLTGGSSEEIDVAVIAVGVRPATDWLQDSLVPIKDGVVCDRTLQVHGLPGVVAAGDIARWPHPVFDGRYVRVEHWTNALEQGAAAAHTLLSSGTDAADFRALPSFWSEQFGVGIQSIGLPHLGSRLEVTEGSLAARRFVALFAEEDLVVGAVAFDMPRELAAVRSLVEQRAPMTGPLE
jgi:NADPH-dependent 2,4-dienoyl-CoA reductase/sulfur reductase-like enzyme